MEVSALKHPQLALRGPAPLLRLASDEQLVALIRRGQHSAFEALVGRYQSRLLAFCRHMLRSQEDAEDILQEVFAAAFNALLADEREINVRPWLYRIARNRSLNHLRRSTAIGVDSMDVLFADHGQSTMEKVSRREDFRLLLEDIGRLPETQRTAIVLREMDALSYEQIAEAMDTTVPGVKSLLVRARVSLAEAAEARKLTCDEVRLELAAIAEGLARMSAPYRRHVKACKRCTTFRTQLRSNNRALALALPVAPMLMAKKLLLAKISFGGGSAGAGAGGAAAGVGLAGSGGTAGVLTAGALTTKAVAGIAAAALVTAGAVEVRHVHGGTHLHHHSVAPTQLAALPAVRRAAEPAVIASRPQPSSTGHRTAHRRARPAARPQAAASPAPVKPVARKLPAAAVKPPAPLPPTTQQESGTTVLPSQPPPATTAPAAPPPAPAAATGPAPPPPTAPTTTVSTPPPTTTSAAPQPTTNTTPR